MNDEARWLKDREALGFSKRGLSRALLTFRGMFGRKFNALTVVEYLRLYPRPGLGAETVWLCECSCSGKNKVEARYSALTGSSVKSCGRCNEHVSDAWTEQFSRLLALSLEFEGSLGVYEAGGYHIPKIAIGVRDYAAVLVETICKEAGLGAVCNYVRKDGTGVAQWQVAGRDAQTIAKRVFPFMICKKRQAELILEFPSGRQGKRVTPEDTAKRIAARVETRKLNARGPREPGADWMLNAERWIAWIHSASVAARAELLAWAVEWEGQITLNERVSHESVRGAHHQLGFGLRQVTHRRANLCVAQALAGGLGRIYDMKAPPRPGEAPCSSWEISSYAEIKSAAALVKDKLVYKKRLAEIACEFPLCDTKPTPQDVFDMRRSLTVEASGINATVTVEEDEE